MLLYSFNSAGSFRLFLDGPLSAVARRVKLRLVSLTHFEIQNSLFKMDNI